MRGAAKRNTGDYRVKSDALLALGVSDVGGARSTGSKSFEFDTCFVAGTLVYTKEGYKGIEEINVGDLVLSHNEKTGQLSFQRVTETYVHDVPLVHKITYHNGTVVETTWNHPFYVKGSGWTQVKDLSSEDRSVTLASIQNSVILEERGRRVVVGASLASLGGQASVATPSWSETYAGTIGIRKVEEIRRPEKVYNIEVEGNHSYFVTKSKVLVHNYDKTIREILTNNDLSAKEKMNKLFERDSFTYEGKVWQRQEISPEVKNKSGKVIQEKQFGFFSKENQYGKPDTLTFREGSGGKLEAVQVQKEGEYYKNTKVYDQNFNWKGNVDFAGNLPVFDKNNSESIKFHTDYTNQFAKERGYDLVKDGSGKTKLSYTESGKP
ncbi:hypothetical protein EHO61_10145 [Leptospira fluminis]|uniref:Uncharacterized protein n=1 Tax=Leptospira fluminis TaxID=2484979 RepID=A0A4R9GMX4_9LEPT|nr:polymorphic toxin-type HINT domain-containing protein [Leptospira fluminis]TGK17831.1 hypothetical protein EHO61_10145 [Leptospira fluminis]